MKKLYGIKIWSTNTSLIPQIEKAFSEKLLDYIELFSVPDSYTRTHSAWTSVKIPFIVHAAHSMTGLNFSKKDQSVRNSELASESFRFADTVNADTIIFHPGLDGDIDETVRQAKNNFDSRMIFENKPYRGLDGSVCIGSTPEEIHYICTSLGVSFCLDFGHAVASSNSHGMSPIELTERFNTLMPRMYHLTDGDIKSELDCHEMYGKGNFPLDIFFASIPEGKRVTNEAKRTNKDSIEEYITDRKWVRDNIC